MLSKSYKAFFLVQTAIVHIEGLNVDLSSLILMFQTF